MGIQQAVVERDSEPLELRQGLARHTGEPILEADDFYGKAVNLAALIAGEACASEILVSSLVRELADSSREFTSEAPTLAELKGLVGMYELSAVRWRE